MDIDDFLNKEAVGADEKGRSEASSATSSQAPGIPQGRVQGKPDAEGLLSEIIEIHKLLEAKGFEEGYARYVKAKENFAELTRRQHQEQNRIYNELEDINRKMVEGLNNLKLETSKKIEVIRQLIARANDHQENNRVDNANQLFEQIVELFKSLQDILPDEKLRLEHEIASLHVRLASRKNMAANADFRGKFNTISSMVAYALKSINDGDVDKAVQLYQRINSMYGELPDGFLYEKAVLYQKILKLFNEVRHIQDSMTARSIDNREETAKNDGKR